MMTEGFNSDSSWAEFGGLGCSLCGDNVVVVVEHAGENGIPTVAGGDGRSTLCGGNARRAVGPAKDGFGKMRTAGISGAENEDKWFH
jgi:hypothetical protein